MAKQREIVIELKTSMSLVFFEDEDYFPSEEELKKMSVETFINKVADLGTGCDEISDYDWIEISRQVQTTELKNEIN